MVAAHRQHHSYVFKPGPAKPGSAATGRAVATLARLRTTSCRATAFWPGAHQSVPPVDSETRHQRTDTLQGIDGPAVQPVTHAACRPNLIQCGEQLLGHPSEPGRHVGRLSRLDLIRVTAAASLCNMEPSTACSTDFPAASSTAEMSRSAPVADPRIKARTCWLDCSKRCLNPRLDAP